MISVPGDALTPDGARPSAGTVLNNKNKVFRPYLSEIFIPCMNMIHKRMRLVIITVKPVCNDHLYNKIYYLQFIQ